MTQKAKDIYAALARRDAKFAAIMPPEATPAAPPAKEEESDANNAKSEGNQ